VSTLSIDRGRAWQRTWQRPELEAVAGTLAEGEVYIAPNRFYGPRGGSRRLAALNALWLDLDTYRVPALAALEREEVAALILRRIAAAELPPPSFLIDSGRGHYCVWLIRGAVPAARPRWSATMRALVEWALPLGADPACVDAARVLRMPDSWHAGTGRQVTVVAGDGARYDFGALADAIWRAAGRPTREALSRRRARGRSPRRSDTGSQAPRQRGLSRPGAWRAVLVDLEALLESWGGTVPTGLRDLWLHAYACALAWTTTEVDIASAVVAKGAVVAPDLPSRDVLRMIGTTARRAAAAAAGRCTPDGRDPRYDYSGGRLAELLCVDRQSAEVLALQQVIPPELRSHRTRQRRIERRGAAGVLPRSIWLALNPASRERPWRAEGISRATWYRRRKHDRERHWRDRVSALLAGTAAVAQVRETGAVPLYGGVALPSAPERRPEALTGLVGVSQQSIPAQPPPAFALYLKPSPKNAARPQPVSPAGEPDPDPNKAPAGPVRQEMPTMPSLADPHVLAAAAQRLSAEDLGTLTRVAVTLAKGPCSRQQLIDRARLRNVDVVQLGPWLRRSVDGQAIVGLEEAPAVKTPAAGPRQGGLFTEREFLPPPEPVPSSIRAAVITTGKEALRRAGISSNQAGSFLGKLLRDHPLGAVAEAVDALARTEAADPRAWVQGYIRRHHPGGRHTHGVRPGQTSAVRHSGQARSSFPPAERPPHPDVTPEFLGVSPARTEWIREVNRLTSFSILSPEHEEVRRRLEELQAR
jgi:hypothetical protein